MKIRPSVCFILLGLLLVLLFAADLLLGSVSLAAGEVVSVLTGHSSDPQATTLVTHFRLPKAVSAIVVGAALSASGLQMQTLFRNPLAGPYVLGISSGASLGVSLFLLGAPLLGISFASEALRNVGIVGSAWIGGALILLVDHGRIGTPQGHHGDPDPRHDVRQRRIGRRSDPAIFKYRFRSKIVRDLDYGKPRRRFARTTGPDRAASCWLDSYSPST